MIEIKDLSFEYTKNKPVLQGFSLDINEGDCVIILGPNGVGKSTLLKCILGFLNYKDGSIKINGKELKEIKPKEKAKLLSYVPQQIEETELTIEETLELGRLPYFDVYLSKKDKELVSNIIDQFELNELKYKRTNEISGGERQKVAIAKALLQDTETIVFDEPTSNLDLKSQLDVINIIKAISKENKKSIIVSMHDINLALALGNKFVFMKNGKIVEICRDFEISSSLLSEVYDTKIKEINVENRRYFTYEEIN